MGNIDNISVGAGGGGGYDSGMGGGRRGGGEGLVEGVTSPEMVVKVCGHDLKGHRQRFCADS